MTSPTTADAEAVALFAAEHPECEDGDQVADLCFDYSEQFRQFVLDLGTDLEVQVVGGFRFAAPNVILTGHAATRVGDLVYDWTYRQFDPATPVPLITPYAEWRADWRTP